MAWLKTAMPMPPCKPDTQSACFLYRGVRVILAHFSISSAVKKPILREANPLRKAPAAQLCVQTRLRPVTGGKKIGL